MTAISLSSAGVCMLGRATLPLTDLRRGDLRPVPRRPDSVVEAIGCEEMRDRQDKPDGPVRLLDAEWRNERRQVERLERSREQLYVPPGPGCGPADLGMTDWRERRESVG